MGGEPPFTQTRVFRKGPSAPSDPCSSSPPKGQAAAHATVCISSRPICSAAFSWLAGSSVAPALASIN